MDSSSKWSLMVSLIIGISIFKSPLEVDGHILVYRRLTNQLMEEYNDMPAQFGPILPSNGLKVFGIPVVPNDFACEKISPPPKSIYPSNAKFAAIIQRGGFDCTFELKVRNAQSARYDAAIIYNNESDDLEHMSAQNSSGILIPSVFVGHTTGMTLKSFFTKDIVLVINDELPFNINTQLILPFAILIGLCFLIMILYMIYKCIREERRLRRHRLPKRMLKKLPIIKFTKNSDLAYDTCVICLDDFAEGDKLRILPCKHPYHSVCIDVWLTENKRDCPICKRKVFTKGETRSQRNRQSSLDSITDTDDDTTPLLQQSTNSPINATVATQNSPNTTSHGTFRSRANNNEVGSGGDVTSDDENMLSPARRINPFDRSPNLPPHLAAQLNNESRARSLWSWPVLRWFRQPTTISIVAPPFQEEPLTDVVSILSDVVPPTFETVGPYAASSNNVTSSIRASHSSNNVLNPNLSGSFQDADGDDDDAPLQCIYEPVSSPHSHPHSQAPPPTNSQQQPPAQEVVEDFNINVSDTDSVFIQTPTQGGIAVAALPLNNNENNTTNVRLWEI